RRPVRLTDARIGEVIESGAPVVDTRTSTAFGSGHIPGTINIPLTKSFTTWAGWLISYSSEFYLLVEARCRDCIDEAVKVLGLIGLARIAGYLGSEVFESWRAAGGELQPIERISTEELAARLEDEDVQVVDVRSESEWEQGHLPSALHIP